VGKRASGKTSRDVRPAGAGRGPVTAPRGASPLAGVGGFTTNRQGQSARQGAGPGPACEHRLSRNRGRALCHAGAVAGPSRPPDAVRPAEERRAV